MVVSVVMGCAGVAIGGPSLASTAPTAPQVAQCPNASTHDVAATGTSPAYTYTRGCVVSFDGTPIVYNLFEPTDASETNPVYTILEGPGWSSAGDTSPDPELIKDDYAELTWDPRGFGQSGGVAEVDAPWEEGRDVSSLIDMLATHTEIARDVDGGIVDGSRQPRYANDSEKSNTYGQPVVGMTSYSYGGGIQFAAASVDARIKAIVPGWAWNNLDYSLFPGNTVKLGWDELLYGAGVANGAQAHVQGDLQNAPGTIGGDGGVQVGGYDPMLHYAEATGTALGYPDQTTRAWFYDRSMAAYGTTDPIRVPTLMIQGTVDTLFNLNDAWSSYLEIEQHDPGDVVKMIAYCDGHAGCPTGSLPSGGGYSNTASATTGIAPKGTTADGFAEQKTLDWFDYYLRGQNAAAGDGMPAKVVYQDQDGNFYGTNTFPTYKTNPSIYEGSTIPAATFVSTGVPAESTTNNNGSYDPIVTDGVSAPGPLTEDVPINLPANSEVLGEPHVSLNVTVNGPGAILFFKLVDTTTNQVVDLQTSPIRLDNLDLADNLAGVNIPITAENIALDLGGVAWTLGGDHLELQITTSSVSFAGYRGAAEVSVNGGNVYVPVLGGAA